MRFCYLLLVLLITFIIRADAYAAKMIDFSHKDWHVVCDNTLTCRAVGYSGENGGSALSLLLIRKAGANQPFTAYVKTNDQQDELQQEDSLTLFVNDQFIGKLKNRKDEAYKLSQYQISKIIRALKVNNNTVTFHQNNNEWMLSDSGFNAVMLKMDAMQGRIGTIGAVVKHGNINESRVYAPIPAPVIKKAKVSKLKQSKQLTLGEVIKIFPRFKERYDDEAGCYAYDFSNAAQKSDLATASFQLIKLNNRYNLLEASCWTAAYNDGQAYWIIPNAAKPHDNQIKFVTDRGSYYKQGDIVAYQKVRGVGDCWTGASWTWDGHQFLLSSERTASSCRGFAGGTWYLPTFVTKVLTQ